MKKLTKNVIGIWGECGQQWLDSLPEIIVFLSKKWNLTEIKPVDNLSYNYVALAMQHINLPVVLKVSCDYESILNEYRALKQFNGNGSVQVIDFDEQKYALLLEQCQPGSLLKDQLEINIDQTINHYIDVIRKLAPKTTNLESFPHVSQWCQAVDRIIGLNIDKLLINKAKNIKNYLLATAKGERLCHGDLHLENIIQHQGGYLAIDPKGVIAEIAFEAAHFDFSSYNDVNVILEIINKLSTALGLEKTRLLQWLYLKLMISIQWFIEDGGDYSKDLSFIKLIYPLLPDIKK
ncbi:aminoglycoside phosphotransferase family protein [Thiotrichales bacterium 19S9-12]|nr:aminoglycoside phosphotransferase family protein [Thiotrichales bacterium 19S9-11]MCF6811206.1 aminoglycoside phosphotransferase family protein [Thiotrichales bacterium 19S9-12]